MKSRPIPVLAALLLLATACAPKTDYVSIVGYAQGGTYSIKLNLTGSDLLAEDLKTGIDSILTRIDTTLSGYNENSLLTRFNAGDTIIINDIFADIYARSQSYYNMTGTCVDVSGAPLFDLWGFGFTADSLPPKAEVDKVLKNIGMNRLKENMGQPGDTLCAADLLKVKGPAPKLNYNAVAQGYSCDLIASYLNSHGIKDMLIDVGGEIFCSGLSPAGRSWTIGLDKPLDGNDSPGENLQCVFEVGPDPVGVVTSGNYRKFYVKDGKKYAHTIDPRTGYPVTHSLLSATVIAPDAAQADALATYCMVVGMSEAVAYISSRPDLEGCLVYDEGGELKTWTSAGFKVLR